MTKFDEAIKKSSDGSSVEICSQQPDFLEDNSIFPRAKESIPVVDQSDVQKAIESILSDQEIEQRFYKSIDPSLEFGISRTVSDKLYHLPKLLSHPELVWQEGTTTYIISSSTTDSLGHTITLEHRLQATSHKEAEKIAKIFTDQLRGILHKIHIATWKLANVLKRFTFTCKLTELMKLCYPNRETYFQNQEKLEFYEHLRALENTKILYSRNNSSKSGKGVIKQSIEFRLIEINNKVGKKEEYPQSITLTVLNTPALQNEKLAFVGAGYRNSTLQLQVEDISLAAWIQARKAQSKDGSAIIVVEECYLFKVAGLEKTAKANKSHARKKLKAKLDRYAEQGIIRAPVEKQGDNLIIRFK